MEWFNISYNSVGVFVAAIVLWLMSLFILFKKDKTAPTWWLFGLIFGFSILVFGYVIGYSVNAPWGVYHRYFTLFVVYGNWAFIGFAYSFPKNDFKKEARIIVPLAFVLLTILYIEFVITTQSMEIFYNFTAHTYTFDYGAGSAVFILLSQLFAAIVMIRKTIFYSSYSGRLSNWETRPSSFAQFPRILISKFLIGWIKFFKAKGQEAIACKGFSLMILSLLIIAISNVLNKSGALSYDKYALVFSTGTLLITFFLVMLYINNSPEPTTFMIKLVGVSLVTILLVIGFVGNLTLAHSEKEYDNKRKIEINLLKKNITNKNYSELPETIQYILTKPASEDFFEQDVSLLFKRPIALINRDNLISGVEKRKKLLLSESLTKVMKSAGRNFKKDIPTDAEKEAAFQIFKSTRIYSNLKTEYQMDFSRLYREAGERYVHFDFIDSGTRFEVGYSYNEYRKLIHQDAISIVYILFLTGFTVLLIFPKFFHSSLVEPLNKLLDGVKKVNDGNLEIQVPIKIQDEIGYLAGSFNSMVTSIKEARRELQDYAENLEEKVEVRTREVKEKMEEVHKLKVQQDGDYFLTSLLAKPLFFNANKSKFISTEFLIRQKKKFEFRNKTADLGGDICISGNLRFGTPEKNRKFTMAINGDAMGKSMQGAGGSLVMGVVMNAIMSRSASNKKILSITPEQWLLDVHKEVDSVFKSFDGTMVISAVIVLIDELSGEMFYINAEHPASILYRDGKAEFIEKELLLRKFGSESEFECEVHTFKLEPGDILILGSDGRDDIDLTPNANVRTINEDETMILGIVEKADADCREMERILDSMGTITDDLSFLKISFQTSPVVERSFGQEKLESADELKFGEIDMGEEEQSKLDLPTVYQKSKQLYHDGNINEALDLLAEAYTADQSNQKLNKLLGLISFKGKNYSKAVEVLDKYLQADPDTEEILYYLSLSQKKIGNYSLSLEASQRVYELDPNNLNNLINLADLHRLNGNIEKAKEFSLLVLEVDSENKNARKILNHIDSYTK